MGGNGGKSYGADSNIDCFSRPPLASDFSFSLGFLWIDVSVDPNVVYLCSNNSSSGAEWSLLGISSHNKGYYASSTELIAAHPSAEVGDWAIVGDTDTVWVWDGDTGAWLDTGSGSIVNWGDIGGSLVDQVDLKSAIDAKVDIDGTKVLSDVNYSTSDKNKLDGINAFSSMQIPIEYPEDGVVAPAAYELYDDLDKKKVNIRKFAGDADNDVTFNWSAPLDIKVTTPLKFRVKGIITEVTGPSSEGVVFALKGFASADDAAGSQSYGSEVSVAKSAMSHVTGDIFVTDWSGDVVIPGLSVDTVNQCVFSRLATNVGDTYAQSIGVVEVEIKYEKT